MKVLIVDDHAIVRAGLRRLFAALPDAQFSEAATGCEALALARTEQPAMIVLDLNLPGLSGLELLRRLLVEHPTGRVLVLSMYAASAYAARALRAGAAGYLSKNVSPEELIEAAQRISEGGRYVEAEIAQALALQAAQTGDPMERLAMRDIEILRLLGDGQSSSDIAAALGVSYKTVANACSQIKAKLGVARTANLIRLSLATGAARGDSSARDDAAIPRPAVMR